MVCVFFRVGRRHADVQRCVLVVIRVGEDGQVLGGVSVVFCFSRSRGRFLRAFDFTTSTIPFIGLLHSAVVFYAVRVVSRALIGGVDRVILWYTHTGLIIMKCTTIDRPATRNISIRLCMHRPRGCETLRYDWNIF